MAAMITWMHIVLNSLVFTSLVNLFRTNSTKMGITWSMFIPLHCRMITCWRKY